MPAVSLPLMSLACVWLDPAASCVVRHHAMAGRKSKTVAKKPAMYQPQIAGKKKGLPKPKGAKLHNRLCILQAINKMLDQYSFSQLSNGAVNVFYAPRGLPRLKPPTRKKVTGIFKVTFWWFTGENADDFEGFADGVATHIKFKKWAQRRAGDVCFSA